MDRTPIVCLGRLDASQPMKSRFRPKLLKYQKSYGWKTYIHRFFSVCLGEAGMGRREANTDLRTKGGGSSKVPETHPRTGRGGQRNDLGKIWVVNCGVPKT